MAEGFDKLLVSYDSCDGSWCRYQLLHAWMVGKYCIICKCPVARIYLHRTNVHALKHITSTYRQEYFSNLLSKPISFYDEADNSVGALCARTANDPTQLQQLLGINMGAVLTSVLNVGGCLAISFYFSWKLTLIIVCSTVPIVVAAGFIRVRYETDFEKMNWKVFSESSKFATESIGAIRTVSALTLEDSICKRYEELLDNHIKTAFRKARISTLIFAVSDSISLLCMAFAMWYGCRMLSKYELWPFNYLVVYLAIVQGSIGAGQWLSFGPNIAQAAAAANRIRSMRAKHRAADISESKSLDQIKDGCGAKIELENIWFKYPTRDVHVLKGLDIKVSASLNT
jgi:ATP-binding cassette, subfamily B (MDR/TAP), member 1